MKEKLAELYYETHKIDASYTSKIIDAFIAGWEAKEASIGGDEVLDRIVSMAVGQKDSSLRYGQSLFNALHELYPEIANKIRGTDADPFYSDSKIKDFVKAINFYSPLTKGRC